MEALIPLIIGLVIITVVGAMVYVNLRESNERDPLQDRIAKIANDAPPESLLDIEMQLSFRDRVLVPLIKRFSEVTTKFTPQKQLEGTRRQMQLAGDYGDPSTFFMKRIIFTIIFGIAGFVVGFFVAPKLFGPEIWKSFAIFAGLTLFGYFAPTLSLKSKISKRQENITKSLPDALDLLTICVEAGLGFDQAMGKVFEKWDDELALAFGRVLREVQMGVPRVKALRDMSDRMDVADVNSFVSAIIQSEQMGVSMSKILRIQSEQMRVKRRQRAQEKAQQAPVKMLMPMVLLIFPSIWIVLLGPAMIQVKNTLPGLL
ncbi:type II secretion system F family protein [Anaerolineales bacterium]